MAFRRNPLPVDYTTTCGVSNDSLTSAPPRCIGAAVRAEWAVVSRLLSGEGCSTISSQPHAFHGQDLKVYFRQQVTSYRYHWAGPYD